MMLCDQVVFLLIYLGNERRKNILMVFNPMLMDVLTEWIHADVEKKWEENEPHKIEG